MYKICSLFAGVGGIELGFIQTNNCEVSYANDVLFVQAAGNIKHDLIATF